MYLPSRVQCRLFIVIKYHRYSLLDQGQSSGTLEPRAEYKGEGKSLSKSCNLISIQIIFLLKHWKYKCRVYYVDPNNVHRYKYSCF